MGIVLSLGGAGSRCCMGIAMKKRPKVLQIVKPDCKILEYSSPILVRDVPMSIAASGIGIGKGSSQHLPPDYELQIGEVYYVLPPRRPPDGTEPEPARRIKVVITKQQLQLLLARQVSVQELMAGLDNKKTLYRGAEDGLALAWRPNLETIVEGVD
ncbi:uncharacterized protein LOC116202924 [Punica granatum]|uniref:Uncharacterized protein n=2 Tax=Punica granatum TaxID=22663 RepID=A0A218X407_PUNGR|nr:uncharacterized protein LOC116202924 [Punica granatum]OWM79673.1 hypothetical protein CDL15_Pgr023085 [Punica granatum]PKI53905.1 hypothetical protein CRG98_025699 [Punica granatum]